MVGDSYCGLHILRYVLVLSNPLLEFQGNYTFSLLEPLGGGIHFAILSWWQWNSLIFISLISEFPQYPRGGGGGGSGVSND